MGCLPIKRSVIPLEGDSEISEIMDKYQFTDKEIQKFWVMFNRTDKNDSGTVSVMEIFRVIKEKPNSVIAPYLTRYISLLEREEGERLKFVEFVRSISKYCLLNPPQILQFVFQCIDENQDGFVSKQDIMQFLRTEQDGKLIFPNNYLRAVELFETQRADKIDWIEFLRLVREVPYLSFPAFRLQQALRLYTLGEFTWKKINKRLINRKSMQELREKEQEAHRQSVQEKIWKLQQYTAENKLTLTSQRSYAAKPRGIVRKHSL